MKKLILLAAAAMTFFACTDKPALGPVKVDSVTLSSHGKTFDSKGGSLNVMVTSSSDWTLASKEDNDWVTTSTITGSDGDVVKFTVGENTAGEDLSAVYVFTVGEAKAELEIKSLAKELVKLETEETDIVLDYNKGEISLDVKSNANYRDIKVNVASSDEWLKHIVNLPGEDENSAVLKFSYGSLESLDDRDAVITLSAEGAADVEINVLQEAKHVLYTTGTNFTAAMAGETVAIPLTANVKYDIKITSDVSGWISHVKREGGNEYFKVNPFASGKRSAVVTFTQTDAKPGEEALVATANITQINVIIKWAADMTGSRLFPKWEGGKLGNLYDFTLETMVYFDDFDKAAGGIMTLMGIEGKYLLRMGDVGNDIHRLQIATSYGNYNCPFEFGPNKWYHVAVTCQYGQVTVYVDGEEVGFNSFGNLSYVDLTPNWSYETGWYVTRCFWMGYSYDSNRDLHGKMTEIRVWTKVLSQEEIQAPNHFYEVDPASEGLAAYWKFTKGEGDTIEDATGKGNTLYGETNVRSQSSTNKGDAGIKWLEVTLPDK